MKKVVSILLLLALCISLCACGGLAQGNSKQALIGEWKSVRYNASFDFRSDGTGTVCNKDGSMQGFSWKYDKELKCYLLAMSQTFTITLQSRDGIAYFEFDKQLFYRTKDYDTGLDWYIKDIEALSLEKVKERTQNYTKIELGKAYPLNDVHYGEGQQSGTYSIVFKDVKYVNDEILLYADITNVKEATGSTTSYETSAYYYAYPMGEFLEVDYFNSYFAEIGQDSICVFPYPGETKSAISKIVLGSDLIETIEKCGVAYGIIELNLDGSVYYLDLSEHIKE